jgi:hypothetical protein
MNKTKHLETHTPVPKPQVAPTHAASKSAWSLTKTRAASSVTEPKK